MFKDTKEGQTHSYDLEYCKVCIQVTNHLEGVCQKCLPPQTEEVEDWATQIDWFLTWFDRHIGSFQNGMCLWDIVDKKVIEGMIREHLKHEINLIVSSNTERVKKALIKKIEDIPEAEPIRESDEYDQGLVHMKNRVLDLLDY